MIRPIQHIHFIGIGGIGMSGLAEVVFRQGYKVSGSDKAFNEQTAHLQKLGVTCYEGHRAEQVHADLVVYTAAVHEDNPEIIEARRKHIPMIKRSALLGEFLREKKGVAVAGTHGKTTTSAMIGMMLEHAGLDPTMFIGGVVRQLGTNAKLSDSAWVVVEADEYDRSFLELHSHIAVINNIESDHLDIYRDLDDITGAFTQFAKQTSFFGAVIGNADDPVVVEVLRQCGKRTMTFGLSEAADLRAANIETKFCELHFDVLLQSKKIERMMLPMSGTHNIKNALACIAAGLMCEVPVSRIAESLAKFGGTGRRFERLGEKDGVLFIDDYAHHPTEIRATLEGARDGAGGRKIIAVFQPHLFSRTRDYFEDFASAFTAANEVILTEIYPAREMPIPGITGEKLYETTKKNHAHVTFVGDKTKLSEAIRKAAKPGDIVITMGAGDITHIGRQMVRGV